VHIVEHDITDKNGKKNNFIFIRKFLENVNTCSLFLKEFKNKLLPEESLDILHLFIFLK
jgi:hypothetical protein